MKKGFTLIELLAVIVILAIISLIAIPHLAKIVSNTQLKADLESVRGYINAAENYYMKAQFSNSMYNTLGTNVIDKLNIKGNRLNGTVVVTKEGKIELAIVKRGKCYKKGAFDNNSDITVLDKSLCNTNALGFVSNNGRLHVEGSKLMNQYNKEARLQGISLEVDLSKEENKKLYSKKTFKSVKDWGTNAIRLFVLASCNRKNPNEYIKYIYEAIDNIIANDMYVIVNWKPGDTSLNPYYEEAKDLFDKINERYPNDPHILYEIWNEANDNRVKWADIKAYANKIIPDIRKKAPDSIILCVQAIDEYRFINLLGNTLDFKNVMYVTHNYPNGVSDTTIDNIVNAINAGIPIFVSEWAGTQNYASGVYKLDEAHAIALAKILKKYNISHTVYCLQPGQWSWQFVKTGAFDESLPDSILTPNALFFKRILQNDFSTKSYLMAGTGNLNSGKFFREDEWRDKIVSIEFKKNISIPKNTVKKWDLSAGHDNTIIGFLTETGEADRYKLTITSEGVINAPVTMSYLFAKMKNLKSIDFSNFKTDLVRYMVGTFKGDSSLESLNLSGFNVSDLSNMQETFNGCNNLKTISLKGWKTGKVELVGYMFSNCYKLEEVDLTGIDVSKVKVYDWIFANCKNLKKVNISNWNPTVITSASSMFLNCSSLNEVDMSYSIFNSSTNLKDIFKGVKNNASIYVKNVEQMNILKDLNFNVNISLKYNIQSGTTGNLSWNFNQSTGMLIIDGNGDMPDFNEGTAPWYKYRNYITDIIVGENVTKIGKYAFYELYAVKNITINSKKLADFSQQDINNGNNFILYHLGKEDGATLIFGPNVEYIPSMFMRPTTYGHDKVNITNFIFKGNKITKIGNHALAYGKMDILVLPEGVKQAGSLSLGTSYYRLVVLPDSLVSITDWLLGQNSRLEKVIFGSNINSLPSAIFTSVTTLKEIVIPHINNTNAHANLFKSTKTPIVIYGDSSTEEFVNNYKASSGLNNVSYKNIAEYKSNITSNSNISGSVGYNDSFTFTANGNVTVYYKYGNYLSNPISVSKTNNSYTIKNIKSDIYIEVK